MRVGTSGPLGLPDARRAGASSPARWLPAGLLLGLLAPSSAAAAPERVGILHAVSDPAWATCTEDMLWCTGDFFVVGMHDVALTTPTLSELQQYKSVMVYGDVAFADPIALGDVLAAYVESGGGLVLNVGPLCDGVTAIAGRVVSQGLLPVEPGTWSAPGGSLSIRPLPEHAYLPGPIAGHPSVYGVNTFQGGDSIQCAGLTLRPNATRIADWSNGEPAVVVLEPPSPAFGRVAAVNFFPPPDMCGVGFWAGDTDGDRLMSQPLLWAMRYVKPPSTTYNTEYVQDLNCNALDAEDEPIIDITLDPECEDNVDANGDPIENNDFYFDFWSHGCGYFTPTYDQDEDFLGGGSITITEGSGAFPDEVVILTCDNCADDYNPDQADQDGDGIGDLCDICPHVNDPMQENRDGDCHGDACDNCFDRPNPNQSDIDGDGVGDACDNCIDVFNPDQEDCDEDGVGDVCDNCVIVQVCEEVVDPRSPNPDQYDSDFDGFGDTCDNCPLVFQDTPQEFANDDGDAFGNACDLCPLDPTQDQVDQDGDGVGDQCDNCLLTFNNDQNDLDLDRVGDACDNCVAYSNRLQEDLDQDGVGDVCDICPEDYDPSQADSDGDGIGDGCDNCPLIPNAQQDDRDGDGFGDACDTCVYIPSFDEFEDGATGTVQLIPNNFDSDNDSVGDICDNCPFDPNPLQQDADGDGLGDQCDLLGLRGGGDILADIDRIQRTGSCSTAPGAAGASVWLLGLLGLSRRRRLGRD